MNNLSNAAQQQLSQPHFLFSCKPIPPLALYILVPVFFLGLALSILILVVVHNAIFFIALLSLSFLVIAFVLWNSFSWSRRSALFFYLQSFPDSDLRLASHGQLVKITGPVSCGSTSLESSYEQASRCVYTSTLLYEYGYLGLRPAGVNRSFLQWRLVFSERVSTDFYLIDGKSGIRALVKAGPDCKVIPLLVESRLVCTTRKCKSLSSHLRKWLRDRNLSTEARLLQLEEGYIKEGTSVSVMGMLHKNCDTPMIVQPPELISTGCLWRKLLLPVDADGLIIGLPNMTNTLIHQSCVERLEQH